MPLPAGFIKVRVEDRGEDAIFNIAMITKVVALGGNSPRCIIYSSDAFERGVIVCETLEVVEKLIFENKEVVR